MTATLTHQAARPAPADGIRVCQAVREFPFAKRTLQRWRDDRLGQKQPQAPLILLGRPLAWGTSGDLTLISRGDLEKIRDIIADPYNRPLPENRGQWIAPGVYSDEEGLWYAASYLAARGVCGLIFRRWWKIRAPGLPPGENGGRARHQVVTWPSVTLPHGGKVVVLWGRHLLPVMKRRGHDLPCGGVAVEGRWLDAGTWQDAGGLWFTSLKVQAGYRVSDIFVHLWCRKQHPALDPDVNGGMLRRQLVDRPHTGRGGRPCHVYHQGDVESTVAWSRQLMPTLTQAPGPGWVSSAELARHLGIADDDTGPLIDLYAVLQLGREARAFPFVRIKKQRGNHKWASWQYELAGVLRALDGKAVGALAAEWASGLADVDGEESAGFRRAVARLRRHRCEEKHLKWKRWKDGGKSYNQIVLDHEHETGETVTRGAVIMALKRLE